MLKIKRPALDPALQAELTRRQANVDRGKAGADPWGDFTKHESKQDAAKISTVRAALRTVFHGKCAYCEADDASEIEHHWPKAPHSKLNDNRGTVAGTFRWENLMWSCHTCNSFECKGSHMKWNPSGRTLLLDPSTSGDDPFCYLTIEQKEDPDFKLGWMDPREELSDAAQARATYTLKRLKLNLRLTLLKGRARSIKRFNDLLASLREFGPDYAVRERRTVRVMFAELLAPEEPYLAGIRQQLRQDTALREELLTKMPELRELVEAWDLPPDDCAAL